MDENHSDGLACLGLMGQCNKTERHQTGGPQGGSVHANSAAVCSLLGFCRSACSQHRIARLKRPAQRRLLRRRLLVHAGHPQAWP